MIFVCHVGNNWKGFPFLFALCTAASLVIWVFVDVEQGRRDAVAFAALHRSQDGAHIADVEEDASESMDDEIKKATE